MAGKRQKLYAYVDESGQDTRGELFLVAVVVVGEQRDQLRELLRNIERESRKNKKWAKERRVRREAYIRRVLETKQLAGLLYYSHYHDTRDYVPLTILSTARAILHQARETYQADMWVDGLNRPERQRFTKGLRDLHVRVPRQARGLTDEADEFIRLADALAGFVRDGMEDDDMMASLYKKALRNKVIREA